MAYNKEIINTSEVISSKWGNKVEEGIYSAHKNIEGVKSQLADNAKKITTAQSKADNAKKRADEAFTLGDSTRKDVVSILSSKGLEGLTTNSNWEQIKSVMQNINLGKKYSKIRKRKKDLVTYMHIYNSKTKYGHYKEYDIKINLTEIDFIPQLVTIEYHDNRIYYIILNRELNYLNGKFEHFFDAIGSNDRKLYPLHSIKSIEFYKGYICIHSRYGDGLLQVLQPKMGEIYENNLPIITNKDEYITIYAYE